MLQLERRRRLKGYGQFLEQQEQRTLSQKAKAVREADRLGQSIPEQAMDEGIQETDTEEEEALKKEIAEEETKQRLAREQRDREWQRLADERNERLRNEAEKTSVLEHGDAVASILGMPAVEEDAQTKDNSVQGQGDELKKA
jgi:non-canonical poly(A) RNA polymerase PAPD5/7